jgi:hypothetical protein
MRAERVRLGEMTVRVYDRGPEPEWHKDRALFGPWLPYEAELASAPSVTAIGWTPYEAILALVSTQRTALLERREVAP